MLLRWSTPTSLVGSLSLNTGAAQMMWSAERAQVIWIVVIVVAYVIYLCCRCFTETTTVNPEATVIIASEHILTDAAPV